VQKAIASSQVRLATDDWSVLGAPAAFGLEEFTALIAAVSLETADFPCLLPDFDISALETIARGVQSCAVVLSLNVQEADKVSIWTNCIGPVKHGDLQVACDNRIIQKLRKLSFRTSAESPLFTAVSPAFRQVIGK